MTAVYALRRLIKLSFACTSWRKSRESLKEFLNRKEKIMTADLARLETMLGWWSRSPGSHDAEPG
jgi:hypothetical protein